MNSARLLSACAAAGVLVLVTSEGCSRERLAARPAMTTDASYVSESDSLPRLRFEDGAISLNDRCPVRKVRLNRRLPPVYVNGQPIGFC